MTDRYRVPRRIETVRGGGGGEGGKLQGGAGDGVRGWERQGARRNPEKYEERLYVAADKSACKN